MSVSLLWQPLPLLKASVQCRRPTREMSWLPFLICMFLLSGDDASRSRPPLPLHSALSLSHWLCRWALSALCFASAWSAVSCAPVPSPDLARGEHPATGNARYDKFFGEMAELARSVPAAAHEVADVQSALARRLGLPDDARADVIGARLRERTARLASEGLTLQLEFNGIDEADASEDKSAPSGEKSSEQATGGSGGSDPTPTATLRTPGREPDARELRLLEVLAQAALSAASVYVEMSQAQRQLHALTEESGALRGESERAFPNAGERTALGARLTDADTLSARLGIQARAATNAADTLISLLDEAANTAPAGPRKRGAKESIQRESTPRLPARGGPAPTDAVPSAERPARRPVSKTPEPLPPAQRPGDFQP
jgi:hypothetical protein